MGRVDQTVKNLFNDCKKGITQNFGVYPEGMSFETPILLDYNGRTCIDYALEVFKHIDSNSLFAYPSNELGKLFVSLNSLKSSAKVRLRNEISLAKSKCNT